VDDVEVVLVRGVETELPRVKQQRPQREDFPLDPALVAMLPPNFARARRGKKHVTKFDGLTTFLWAFTWVWRTNRDDLYRCMFIMGLECVDHYYTPVVTARIFEPVNIMRGTGAGLWLRPFGLLCLAGLHLAEVELTYRFNLHLPTGGKFYAVAQMALVKHVMKLPAEKLDTMDKTKLVALIQNDVQSGGGGCRSDDPHTHYILVGLMNCDDPQTHAQ
jgi:hypothetical protein